MTELTSYAATKAALLAVDEQLAALHRVRSALVTALRAFGKKPKKGKDSKTSTRGSIRLLVLAALGRARPPQTIDQLCDTALASGWHTNSAKPSSVLGLVVRKLVKAGEVKRVPRSKPMTFKLGTVIERPPKVESWQKKVAKARELVQKESHA